MSELIPPEKAAALGRALQTVFGVPEPDELALLTSGLSPARVYRARVRGETCLVRLEMSAPSPLSDPERQYLCLRQAAAAGVAPPVRYTAARDGVAIVDFIEARPLSSYPGGLPAVAGELAGLVARLQATRPFPQLTDYVDGVDGVLGAMRATGIVDEAALTEVLSAWAEVRAAYPRAAAHELVASHNDLNPNNVLYDGTRLWVVDWEAAFANDRHVDPATLAIWYGLEGEAEAALLRTVFGDVDARVQARHFLMQQVVRVFLGAIMFTVAAQRGAEAIRDLAGVELGTLRARMASGQVQVGTIEGQVLTGKAMLNAVVAAARGPDFERAARAA